MSAKRFARFMMTRLEIDIAKRALSVGSDSVDVREHIGGGVHVCVKSGLHLVDIRKYFVPVGTVSPIPTRMGIALKFPEWEKLTEYLDVIKSLSPELTDAEPCFNAEDHANVMGFLQCTECSPYGCDFVW